MRRSCKLKCKKNLEIFQQIYKYTFLNERKGNIDVIKLEEKKKKKKQKIRIQYNDSSGLTSSSSTFFLSHFS